MQQPITGRPRIIGLALTNIKSMLPEITVSGKFLMPFGVKVLNHFYFSAILLVDQRKILSYKNSLQSQYCFGCHE